MGFKIKLIWEDMNVSLPVNDISLSCFLSNRKIFDLLWKLIVLSAYVISNCYEFSTIKQILQPQDLDRMYNGQTRIYY